MGFLDRFKDKKNVSKNENKEMESWEWWVNKGNSLSSLGRLKEAIKCYDMALEINPQHAEAWFNKGVSLDSLGRFDEAIKCYDRALEINPQDADAWFGKAMAKDKLGLRLDAVQSYRRFIKLAPAQYGEQIRYAQQRLRELE